MTPYGLKGRVYAETTNGEYDINGDMIFFNSPFDVILDGINISTEELHVVAIGNEDTVDFIEDEQTCGDPYTIDEFKPYLRPISSMTEEEDKDWQLYKNRIAESCDELLEKRIAELHDWYNLHHFDSCGLIPMGIALEAPEDMYKNE